MTLPPLVNPAREIDAFIASRARGYAHFDNSMPPRYRSILGRRVRSEGNDVAVWGMLNPSSAGANDNDPTVTRVERFTHDMGMAIALVVNVGDYIATKSKSFVDADAPRSALWARFVVAAVHHANIFICGWGANGRRVPTLVTSFVDLVRANLGGPPLYCLRVTEKTNQPEHPLMLPAALRPVVYQHA